MDILELIRSIIQDKLGDDIGNIGILNVIYLGVETHIDGRTYAKYCVDCSYYIYNSFHEMRRQYKSEIIYVCLSV